MLGYTRWHVCLYILFLLSAKVQLEPELFIHNVWHPMCKTLASKSNRFSSTSTLPIIFKDFVIGFLNFCSGGMSNFLYYCALPPMAKPKQGEPSRVLVRFYGQIHGEGALEALLTESVIFTLLSERKLGPKLHGIFPGGRLEEFIPVCRIVNAIVQSRGVFSFYNWNNETFCTFQARPLKRKELTDPEISSIIAEKMAQVHSLDVPISKEPTWLWDTMNRWMSNMKLTLASAQPTQHNEAALSSAVRSILRWQLDAEMDWMRNYLAQLRSPVVFCHNVYTIDILIFIFDGSIYFVLI